MSEPRTEALGVLETTSLVSLIRAADRMVKTAQVRQCKLILFV